MTTTDTRGLCPPSTPDYRDAETYRARCGELERLLADERAARERLTRELDEARAEVERLRADWTAASANMHGWCSRAKSAEAEVERLRAEVLALRGSKCTVAESNAVAAEYVRQRDAAVERFDALQGETVALREQVETLTRERDEARCLAVHRADGLDQWRGVASDQNAWLARTQEEREAINGALGEHATGDTVADVRRLVARLSAEETNVAGFREATRVVLAEAKCRDAEVERTKRYLDRALRGCDARERKAIETDMAAEVGT